MTWLDLERWNNLHDLDERAKRLFPVPGTGGPPLRVALTSGRFYNRGVLYFAYASNMSLAQMKRWCPASRFLGSGRLDGHRFVYDGYSITWDGAVGNIVPSETETVWGALYDITERDRLTIDAFEGYPRSYERKEVEVLDREGNLQRAMTYCRTGRAPGHPHPDYERLVLDGAKDCGLPEDYVDKALRVPRM